MKTVLGVMAIAVFAYLGSILFRASRLPLALRALASSGLAFFVLGVILGPQVTDVLSLEVQSGEVQSGLDVFIQLAIGWVGLLFGLQFNILDLRRLAVRHLAAAGAESLLTLLIASAGLLLLLPGELGVVAPFGMAVLLAAIASTSSPTTGAEVHHSLSPRGRVTDLVRLISSIDDVPAIVVAGAMMCFIHRATLGFGTIPDGLLWLAGSLFLGIGLGVLVHLLTLFRYNQNQLLVIVLGFTIFSGGAAYYLGLSPLFVAMLAGVVVANRSPHRRQFLRSFLLVEKPLYLMLLTLAGALWQAPSAELWLVVAGFVLVRVLGKLLGGLVAGRIEGSAHQQPFGVGLGLLPFGEMGLVIALSAYAVLPRAMCDLVLTAVVVNMALMTLLTPWVLRRLLIRAGEAA